MWALLFPPAADVVAGIVIPSMPSIFRAVARAKAPVTTSFAAGVAACVTVAAGRLGGLSRLNWHSDSRTSKASTIGTANHALRGDTRIKSPVPFVNNGPKITRCEGFFQGQMP